MAGSGCNAYQIRKIYAIGGALGMVKRNEEDDLLHELVEGMTGKKSIKALTYGEACKVIGELEGRQGTPPPRKSGKPLRKTAPGHTSEGQRRKVWALMYRLQDASPMQAINIIRHSYSLSVSSVCRYAQGYVENLQTLQIAQANFRNMLDELERYPDLDTTEALVRVASQNLMTALTSKKDEDWSAVSVDKLMNQISGLTRAVAYKKRVELQNKSDIEAGTGDLKSALWSAMAKERPDLYKQVSAYLDRKAQEGSA